MTGRVRIYEVEITVSKLVKVRVPGDVLDGSDPEDVAEEFATYAEAWPEHLIDEDVDVTVEAVREITDEVAA
jgi:hypothetical protein